MTDRPVSPMKAQDVASSDFDKEHHENDPGAVSPLAAEAPPQPTAKSPSPSPKPRVSFQEPAEEAPPAKPPRPLNPQVQAENTLIEAFPSIDTKVVKAVLAASGGKVEPAFNALLGMSDPDFKPEEVAPPPPPRPKQQQQAPQNQLEADEMYARRLADQYSNAHRGQGQGRGQHSYNQRDPGRRGPNQQRDYDEDGREHSFFDDDLPEIGKNIQQGFAETQKVVNGWINNIRKKIDGDEEEEDLYTSSSRPSRVGTDQWEQAGSSGRQNFGSSQRDQMYGIRKAAEQQQGRRSTEAQRYDADPHELGDDAFERLELRDDEAPPAQPPRTSSRAKANPDLFKPHPRPPQSGPVDEVDAADRHVLSSGQDPEKAKKWQPLTSMTPHPDEDNDPFSLGDDDEDVKEKSDEVRKEDAERLKSAARESISAGSSGGKLKAAERSGSVSTRDKEMDDLMSGKKG